VSLLQTKLQKNVIMDGNEDNQFSGGGESTRNEKHTQTNLGMHVLKVGGEAKPGGNTAQPVESKNLKIPRQLILTGKQDRFEDMDSVIRSNVLDLISLSNDAADLQSFSMDSAGISTLSLRPRWFGNTQCRNYIEEHYDEKFLHMFDNAGPGFYKGDICRACILYQEGGFYIDVDVQLTVPLLQLVDEDTTFMSAYSINGDIFNGIIAAVPKSEILRETLQEITEWYNYLRFSRRHYKNGSPWLMGTSTMFRGLGHVVRKACPTKDLKFMQNTSQWNCGPHVIRLYQEDRLICSMADGVGQPPECPTSRKDAESCSLRFGLFLAGQQPIVGRSFIGWSKTSKCKSVVCTGGH